MGECDKKTAFEILDFFYENGGNFIRYVRHNGPYNQYERSRKLIARQLQQLPERRI